MPDHHPFRAPSRRATCIAAWALVAVAAPSPASVKPCRDASGRIVKCEKPRKPVARCKDAGGKFTACPPEAKGRASISPSR